MPIIDNYTKMMAAAFRRRIISNYNYHGSHTCCCGAQSDNVDSFIMFNGIPIKTNSLCIHYLGFHRAEVPILELTKVEALGVFYGEQDPTMDELTPPPKRIGMPS